MSNTIKIRKASLDGIFNRNLSIPSYQRPYSWSTKQIKNLLDDLYGRKENDIIMMGSIIIHRHQVKEVETFDVVDGQQRLLSFILIRYIFNHVVKKEHYKESNLLSSRFDHVISKKNIKLNSQYIYNRISKKKELNLKNIYFSVVETENLDDAFAFFDSQNSRGKPLEDFDVLKAHHLRFIHEIPLAIECAKGWELIENENAVNGIGLDLLLNTYIARGRNWSSGLNEHPQIREMFKSQRKEKPKSAYSYTLNNYQQASLFSNWEYQPVKSNVLKFRFNELNVAHKDNYLEVTSERIYDYLPFQISQSIEGGEVFFWYTQKYHALSKRVLSEKNQHTSRAFKDFLGYLEIFKHNRGTEYVNEVFISALIFYVDKFGYYNFDQVAKCFFYAMYKLRMRQSTVQYLSIYKYIREDINLFSLIREASFPEFIIDKCNDYNEDSTVFEKNDYTGIRKWIIEKLDELKNSQTSLLNIVKS